VKISSPFITATFLGNISPSTIFFQKFLIDYRQREQFFFINFMKMKKAIEK